MHRMIFHNLPALISVGVEVNNDSEVYVSLASCNRKDQPQRSIANSILNGRLDSGSFRKRTYMGAYTGDSVSRDVYGPIRDGIRELSTRRNVDGIGLYLFQKLHQHGAMEMAMTAPIKRKRKVCSGQSCTV